MDVDEPAAGRQAAVNGNSTDTEDEFDELEYNDEFESILQAAESKAHYSLSSLNEEQHGLVESADELPAPLLDDATLPNSETAVGAEPELTPMDIEDLPVVLLSPFERFRQRGSLSVSDLVGTVWCEVQYDYRLRTLPYLPLSKRPATITSDKGKEIVVDKGKEEGRERIVRRGEKIHKRLEREIHPEEVVVTTDSREDVWGLRFLNMLAALEALITLGTCREIPVVGFVGGTLVTGIICLDMADKEDELTRKPIDKSQDKPQTRSSRQTALTSFFSPTKSRGKTDLPMVERIRTHKVYVSDSKTRARDSLPREADTLAGQLQCMMYKELFDAMLLASISSSSTPPTDAQNQEVIDPSPSKPAQHRFRPSVTPLSFGTVFAHLGLHPDEPFSDRFIAQTRPIILGNGLRLGTAEARTLDEMVRVWERYVADLGLGSATAPTSTSIPTRPASQKTKAKGKERAEENGGRTENRLELVYRRAGTKKEVIKPTDGKRRRRRKHGELQPRGGEADIEMQTSGATELATASQSDAAIDEEEGRLLRLAMAESLKTAEPEAPATPPSTCTPLAIGTGLTPVSRPASRISEYKVDRTSDEEREEDELAWAVEMSLADAQADDTPGEVAVPLSQRSATSASLATAKEVITAHSDDEADNGESGNVSSASSTPPPLAGGTSSGSIIGRHRFQHDPAGLEKHLESVLQYWRGQREPTGVSVEDTRRCGWCEFEEGCEWRARKAQEDWERSRSSKRA